tara:strand:+ start:669 stop:773 length:105 start_codon:yes stop_codon:yes gene_type:complete
MSSGPNLSKAARAFVEILQAADLPNSVNGDRAVE